MNTIETVDSPIRTTMNGKPVLERDAKSVLNLKSGFKEKLLCDGPTVNTGDACAYSCAFCYSAPMMNQVLHPFLKMHGVNHQDVVIRRKDSLKILHSQLVDKKGNSRYLNPLDTRVVFSSTLVDIAANMDLVRETAAVCNLIFACTHWQIRLLTKSTFLPQLVENVNSAWHDRLILGVSTGTLSDSMAAAFEQGTPKVSKRIESLHWLQDHGFRTYGMLCPSLPQTDYDVFAREMADAIRVDRCEHVWAEVINVRGKSFELTYQGLVAAGKNDEAWRLAQVSGVGCQAAWEDYSRSTFLAHTKYIPARKLRYLQYVEPSTREFWQKHENLGAVLLGAAAN